MCTLSILPHLAKVQFFVIFFFFTRENRAEAEEQGAEKDKNFIFFGRTSG